MHSSLSECCVIRDRNLSGDNSVAGVWLVLSACAALLWTDNCIQPKQDALRGCPLQIFLHPAQSGCCENDPGKWRIYLISHEVDDGETLRFTQSDIFVVMLSPLRAKHPPECPSRPFTSFRVTMEHDSGGVFKRWCIISKRSLKKGDQNGKKKHFQSWRQAH
jgi:hypothetical protein